MRRGGSRFGNKPIAADPPSRVVIAIFAEHSTLISRSTIILTPNDRANRGILVQEIVMKRREFLKLSVGTAAVAALSSRPMGEAGFKEIPIRTQDAPSSPPVPH